MKVRLGSLDYDLIVTAEKMPWEDGEAIGMIEEDFCRITVSKNFPQQSRIQSFWHEVVHGMFFELGQKELAEDEGLVDALAKQISFFVKSNNIEKIYQKLDG